MHLYEGIPSPLTENFCWLNDDPFEKMDDKRKPKILFIGVPLSFLAPAPLRVGKKVELLNKFRTNAGKAVGFCIKKDKLIIEMLPFCVGFWLR